MPGGQGTRRCSRRDRGMSGGQSALTGGRCLTLRLRGLIVSLHAAILDVPFVALPLQRVIHRDRLCGWSALWPEADFGVGFFFAKRDRIDVHVHALDVNLLGDIFEHPFSYRFGRVDVLGAARK